MSFMDDPGGHSLDRKLAQLRVDFGEDIAVYDYEDDPLLDSGSGLVEDMNDFNDETFGMDEVGKDFDFSGSTAQYLGVSEDHNQKPTSGASWTTVSSLLTDKKPSGSSAPHRSSSTLNRKDRPISLFEDPLLAPKATASHPNPTTSSIALRPPASAPPPTVQKSSKFRTVEEIENELRANSAASKQASSSKPPPQALTLEQVEAAMLVNTQKKNLAMVVPSRSSTPRRPPFSQPPLHSRTSSAQQIQRDTILHPVTSSPAMPPMAVPTSSTINFPVLNHPAHPTHPHHSEWLRLQQQMYSNIPPQQIPVHPLPASHPVISPVSQILTSRQLPNPPPLGIAHNTRMTPTPSRNGTRTPFLQAPVVTTPVDELRSAAEARIQEQERQDTLRRRKATKIAEMSKYNNLMSQGDKDFITRIQVSQLVNPSHGQVGFDPYADDFYFHVYSAIRASRTATQQQIQAAAADRRAQATSSDERMSQDYDGISGPGMQLRNHRMGERRLTRRDYAIIRMAQNVQRIIDHAKARPKMSQVSLEGALGKISLRTRSAPRQMLQVQQTSTDDLATAVGGENHPGALAGAIPNAIPASTGQPAMRRRQILLSLERLYSIVLEIEQLRRVQPNPQSSSLEPEKGRQQLEDWETQYENQKEKIWKHLRVLDPLGISHPHPFVSFISVPKGKRVLPRVMRLFNREQSLQVLTLLVATFETLDVVSDAHLLDLPLESPYPPGKRTRAELELETEIFMNCVVAPMMTVINDISLELVTGLVSLLMARNDLRFISRSKAGIAFLTLFLSRAELLKSASSIDPLNELNESSHPSPAAIMRWQNVFNQLFDTLSSDFSSLFPSTRSAAAAAFSMPPSNMPKHNQRPGSRLNIDLEDEPVWQLMAALAVSTDADGQQTLVSGLKGKVLENVIAVSKKKVSDESGALKTRNVNLILHAVGLDASMIKL